MVYSGSQSLRKTTGNRTLVLSSYFVVLSVLISHSPFLEEEIGPVTTCCCLETGFFLSSEWDT